MMSTNARIGIMLPDNKIKQIYCHWDGYISGGVGETLVNHYSKIEKIEALLALGDISVLTGELYPTGEHSFDKPESGITIAYGRDRGETDIDAKVVSMDEWNSVFYSSGSDFYYLYAEGEWRVKNLNKSNGWDFVKKYLPDYAHSLTGKDYACNI